MKLLAGLFLLFWLAGAVGAAEVSDFKLSELPGRLDLNCRIGGSAVVHLEENATTGFQWSVRGEPTNCRVALEHLPGRVDICGAPGQVRVKLEPSTFQPGSAELVYRRLFEEESPSDRVVFCRIVPDLPSIKTVPDGEFIGLAATPAALRMEVPVGETREFEMEEDPSCGMIWRIEHCGAKNFSVWIKHEKPWFGSPLARVSVSAKLPGRGMFRLHFGSAASKREIPVEVNGVEVR